MDPTELRSRRLEAGLSQEKLARLVDVSYGTVANWENGKSSPSIEHAKAISVALEWPITSMLGLEEDVSR